MGTGLGWYGQQPPWPVVAARTTWIPGPALSPSCTGAGGDEALFGWLTGSSEDLPPCALSAAVQDEVFAGTGRNSRLSLGLVVLWLIFLNCK